MAATQLPAGLVTLQAFLDFVCSSSSLHIANIPATSPRHASAWRWVRVTQVHLLHASTTSSSGDWSPLLVFLRPLHAWPSLAAPFLALSSSQPARIRTVIGRTPYCFSLPTSPLRCCPLLLSVSRQRCTVADADLVEKTHVGYSIDTDGDLDAWVLKFHQPVYLRHAAKAPWRERA